MACHHIKNFVNEYGDHEKLGSSKGFLNMYRPKLIQNHYVVMQSIPGNCCHLAAFHFAESLL